MYVKVSDEKDGLLKALKIFSKMIKKSELMQELKNREFFLKPSKKRLFKKKEAFRRRKREERRVARQKRYEN
jgi:small subunit ribosomal protein S21